MLPYSDTLKFIKSYTSCKSMKDDLYILNELSIDIDYHHDSLSQLEKENEHLSNSLLSSNSKISELTSINDSLANKISFLESKILELTNSNDSLSIELSKYNTIHHSDTISKEDSYKSLIDHNLSKIPIRNISVDGKIITNHCLILRSDKLPSSCSKLLTQDELKIRYNIKSIVNPNKTEKRKEIAKKYYLKKKSINSSIS